MGLHAPHEAAVARVEHGPSVPRPRRLKDNHGGAGTVVGVHKGDARAVQLERLIQRVRHQAGGVDAQLLGRQPGGRGRAVHPAPVKPAGQRRNGAWTSVRREGVLFLLGR